MLPERDQVRMQHMLDACRETLRFVRDRTRADLTNDRMLSFAIVRALEILGEAASRVTAETREACPGLPWSSIVGMRNRLIHGYFDIDLDRVWDTVILDLPALEDQLTLVLRKHANPAGTEPADA